MMKKHIPETAGSKKQTIRARHSDTDRVTQKPWTAPDFLERRVGAEIGAYAFQDK
jgi:coenzyme PQQ precursor peptide PqqA